MMVQVQVKKIGEGVQQGLVTLNPYFIEIWPAARFMRSLGTKNGETFLGPFQGLELATPWRSGGLTPLSYAREVL